MSGMQDTAQDKDQATDQAPDQAPDQAMTATENLREAVRRKAEAPSWTGPEDRTANAGPAETPNAKIAPSGALHAEGMRAAIARSTGAR